MNPRNLQRDPPHLPGLTLSMFFIVASAIAFWRFSPWMPKVFYGDDLDYFLSFIDGTCATRGVDILMSVCHERFRPVSLEFVLVMMRIFGTNVFGYTTADIALQGLIATIVFTICWKLSNGSWTTSLSLALAVVLSRFATYLGTQVIGPVESIPLALSLGALYALLVYDRSNKPSWAAALTAVAASLLATFAHERFMVVPAWLAAAFLAANNIDARSRTSHWLLIGACLSIPALYIAYKQLALGTHFLIGTGGTHLAFAPSHIIEHGTEALQSVFGFNSGPDYLVGTPVSVSSEMFMPALIFTLFWAGIFLIGIVEAVRLPKNGCSLAHRFRWPLLLLSLACLLLAPALLTIRLEQRWIFASFILGMLIPAWAVGRASPPYRKILSLATVLLSVASITLDSSIMKSYQNVFFVSSAKFAELVKKNVADPAPGETGTVALLADASECDWTLLDGNFFRLYGGNRRPVHCFSSLEAAAAAALPQGTHTYAMASGSLVDVTDYLDRMKWRSLQTVAFDFVKLFSNGKISDPRDVETPSRRGAFLMPWSTITGRRDTLTVLSGFSYRFDDVIVPDDGLLILDIGMVYPSPQAARALITVSVANVSKTIYQEDLHPPTKGAPLKFNAVSLPLKAFNGQRVSILFSVESPGGDSTGHWVAFADPRLVARSGQ